MKLLILLSILWICNAYHWNYNATIQNEPFTIIQPDHLIGLYHFDHNQYYNEIETLYGNTNYSVISVRTSPDAITGDGSLYADGDILLSTNISYDTLIHPSITIGGWIKLDNPDSQIQDSRYIFSHSKSSISTNNQNSTTSSICSRGLYVDKTWKICLGQTNQQQETQEDSGIPVLYNQWNFISLIYNQYNQSVLFYVNGMVYTIDNYVVEDGNIGEFIIGQMPGMMIQSTGFRGLLDNIFIYNTILSIEELTYLQSLTHQLPHYIPSIGNAGYAGIVSNQRHIQFPINMILNTIQTELTIMLWYKINFIQKDHHMILLQKGLISPTLTTGSTLNPLIDYSIIIYDSMNMNHEIIRKITYTLQNQPSCLQTLSTTETDKVIKYERTIELGQPTNDWQHLSLLWDGDHIQLLLNGTEIDQIDTPLLSMIGGNCLSNQLQLGGDSYYYHQKSSNSIDYILELDEISIWDIALSSDMILHSYRQLLSSTHINDNDEEHMLIYLPFNEGYGLTTQSIAVSTGYLIGMYFPPLISTHAIQALEQQSSSSSSSALTWKLSTVPIDYDLQTTQLERLFIQLNGSDYFQRSIGYKIRSYPISGDLLFTHSDCYLDGEIVSSSNRNIPLNTLFSCHHIYYQPEGNYIGSISFSYQVSILDIMTNMMIDSPIQTISLMINYQEQPTTIQLTNGTIQLSSYHIDSIDSILSTDLLVGYVEVQKETLSSIDPLLSFPDDNSITASVTTQQNLLYSIVNQVKSSKSFENSTFVSELPYLNNAIEHIDIHFSKQIHNTNISLAIGVNTYEEGISNNQNLSYVFQNTSMNIVFTSLPYVTSITPSSFLQSSIINITITGYSMSNDILYCMIQSQLIIPMIINAEKVICPIDNQLSSSLPSGKTVLIGLITKSLQGSNMLPIHILSPIGLSSSNVKVMNMKNNPNIQLFITMPTMDILTSGINYYCRIDENLYPLESLTPEQYQCIIPRHQLINALIPLFSPSSMPSFEFMIVTNAEEILPSSEKIIVSFPMDIQFNSIYPLSLTWSSNIQYFDLYAFQDLSLLSTGLGLNNSSSLCRLGDYYYGTGVMIGNHIVRCLFVLPNQRPLLVPAGSPTDSLEVAFALYPESDFQSTGYSIQMIENITLVEIEPRFVSQVHLQQENIIIYGEFYDRRRNYTCLFNETIMTLGTVISTTSVSCAIPIFVASSGIVAVEIMHNERIISSNALSLNVFTFPKEMTMLTNNFIFASSIIENNERNINTDVTPVIATVIGQGLLLKSNQYCVWTLLSNGYQESSPFFPKSATFGNCNVPLTLSAGKYSLMLQITQHESVLIDSNIQIARIPEIVSFSPATGPKSVSTTVTFYIQDLMQDSLISGLTCLLNKQFNVPVKTINASTIECIVPPVYELFSNDELVVPLTISLQHDYVTSHQEVIFTYYSLPILQTVVPFGGSIAGGNTVYITGQNFIDFGTTKCYFSSVDVSAIIINSTTVVCAVPPSLNPKVASLWISLNGEVENPNIGGLEYQYWAVPEIISSSLSIIPNGGNGIITLDTKQVVVSSTTKCVLNSQTWSIPVALTENKIICSFNETDSSRSEVSFGISYDEKSIFASMTVPTSTISIETLTPEFIQVNRTAAMALMLQVSSDIQYTADDFTCMLGSSEFLAQSFEMTEIGTIARLTCNVHINNENTYSILILYRTVSLPPASTKLSVYNVALISSVLPSRIFAAVTTMVSVNLMNSLEIFPPMSVSQCTIGQSIFSALIVSNNSLSCNVTLQEVGNFPLSISIYGEPSRFAGYIKVASVNNVTFFPNSFPVARTSSLTVTGNNFDLTQTFSSNFIIGDSMESFQCDYVDTFTVSCITPTIIKDSEGRFQFFVDGLQQVDSLISFYADLTIDSYYPSVVSTSGSIVNIKTNASVIGDRPVFCIINDEQFVISSRENENIVCPLKAPLQLGYSTIKLSLNGQDPSLQFATTQVFSTPIVQSVFPLIGLVDGGSIIDIFGSDFTSPTVYCRFGESSIVSANILSTTQVQCIVLATDADGVVDISLSVNEVDYIRTGFIFEYISRPMVDIISPKIVPEIGGSVVSLQFTSPIRFKDSFIRFENDPSIRIAAVSVNNFMITFAVPAYYPGSFNLLLEVHEQMAINLDTELVYFLAPSITDIYPNTGSSKGGSIVSVRGSNFINESTILCKFGDDGFVAGVFIDPTTVHCVTPVISKESSKTVSLSVSFNGIDYSSSTKGFTFVDMMDFSNYFPKRGSTAGSTVISFILSIDLLNMVSFCKIDELLIPLIKQKDIALCTTPLSISAGFTNVELLDRDQSVVDMVPYEYFFEPALSKLWPQSISDSGGFIQISGEDISTIVDMKCSFDSMESSLAIIRSDTLIICPVPILPVGKHQVTLLVDNITYGKSFDFWVNYNPIIDGIYPSDITAQTSDIFINIMTKQIVESSYCNFTQHGRNIIAPVIDNGCFAPLLEVGEAIVIVSVVNENTLSTAFTIQVYPAPIVQALSPLVGLVQGGAIVNIFGAQFLSEKIFCRFGEFSVEGMIVSTAHVQCITPNLITVDRTIDLQISINGEVYQKTGLTMHFVTTPIVESINPNSGPDIGGTNIILKGSFSNLEFNSIVCLFGDDATSMGSIIDSSTAICVSPMVPPGEKTLQISYNGQQFVDTSFVFTFVARETLFALSRSDIFSNEVGSTVGIVGTNFINSESLSCRYNAQVVVPATFINSSFVECIVIAVPNILSLSVEVANNGVNFVTSESAMINFFSPVQMESVSPNMGSINGGTIVQIIGSNFPEKLDVYCSFDDILVTAKKLSDTSVSCDSPKVVSSRITTVGLQFGKDLHKSSSFQYYFANSLEVTSLTPTTGGEKGGWKIDIFFNGSTAMANASIGSYSCRFSREVIIPAIRQYQSISCIVPSLSVQTHSVEISQNNADYLLVGYVDITSVAVLKFISPSVVSKQGGEVISVSGNFPFTTVASSCCEINGEMYPSLNGNLTTISCVIPPQSTTNEVARLRVVQCDAYTGYSQALLNFPEEFAIFSYSSNGVVTSVFPLSTFVTTESSISLYGNAFHSEVSYYCQFTMADNTTQTIDAVFQTSQLLTCAIPVVTVPQKIAVALNYGNTVSNIVYQTLFTYYDLPTIQTTTPSKGMTTGGNSVVMTLSNKIVLNTIYCMFGKVKSPSSSIKFTADGTYMQIVCIAPPSVPINTEIYLSQNGIDYVATGFAYQYIDDITVESIDPLLLTKNVQNITVTGNNFEAARAMLCCSFNYELLPAIILSSTELQCIVPASVRGHNLAMNYQLQLFLDCVTPINTGWTVKKVISPSALQAIPLGGADLGGTIVTIRGFAVGQTQANVFCKFGDILASATVIDIATIVCTSPSYLLPENTTANSVALSVSIDGGNTFFDTIDQSFTYYQSLKVVDFNPLVIIEDIPVEITMRSLNIYATLLSQQSTGYCRIGSQLYPLMVQGLHAVKCYISSPIVGQHMIGISANGQDFEFFEEMINVIPEMKILNVYPMKIFAMDKVQTITIEIAKYSSEELNDLISATVTNCKIDSRLVPAKIIEQANSSFLISCPYRFVSNGSYSLDIQSTATTGSLLMESIGITVISTILVTSMKPVIVSGPTFITLEGLFSSPDELNCMIKLSNDSTKSFVEWSSTPVFVDNHIVTCLVDVNSSVLPIGSSAAHALVGLSFSDAEPIYVGGISIVTLPSIQTTIPVVIAESVLFNFTVTGNNFLLSFDPICFFGNIAFNGTVEDANTINCPNVILPQPGQYKMNVQVNGDDMLQESTEQLITVLPSPVISTATGVSFSCPFAGALSSISISGTNLESFIGSLYCQIGTVQTAPTVVNNEQLFCSCLPCDAVMGITCTETTYVANLTVGYLNTQSILFAGTVQYETTPEMNLITSPYVMVDTTNTVIVEFPGLSDSLSNTANCRVVDANIDTAFVVVGASPYDTKTLLCEVSCSSIDKGTLQVSKDGVLFYDISQIYCVRQPKLISSRPLEVFDINGGSIEVNLENNDSILTVFHSGTTDDQQCLFGGTDISSDAIIIPFLTESGFSYKLQCTVPVLTVGLTSIRLVWQNISSEPLPLAVLSVPIIENTDEVATIFEGVNKAINIEIRNLPQTIIGKCVVDNGLPFSTAVTVSNTEIMCDLSNVLISKGQHELNVVFDSYTATGSVSFELIQPPQFISVEPAISLIGGSTILVAKVDNNILPIGREVFCNLIGIDTVFNGIVIESDTMVCNVEIDRSELPRITSISFEVANLPILGNHQFIVLSPIKVIDIIPSIGSVVGGSMVEVQGSVFYPFGDYECVFGNIHVPATYKSDSVITCLSPESFVNMNIPVTIASQGVDLSYSLIPVNFHYFDEPIVESIFPSFGSIAGGEFIQVTVGRVNLNTLSYTNILCDFNGILVSGIIVTDSLISCIAPAGNKLDTVDIKISLNGVDFFSNAENDLAYEYVKGLFIHDINPTHITQSEATETTLYIEGYGFVTNSIITCYFGEVYSVTTNWLSPTLISCSIPINLNSNTYSVYCQVNEDQSNTVPFRIEKDIMLYEVLPSRLAAQEVSLGLFTIIGSGFLPYANLSCRFGNEMTTAIYVSQAKLLCTPPTRIIPGVVSLAISINQINYISGLFIIIDSEFVVNNVMPSFGPVSGFTTMLIDGDGFSRENIYICTIGTISVEAMMVNENTRLQCIIPPAISGSGLVSISISTQNTTASLMTSGLFYEYYDIPVALGVTPRFGPVGESTLITILLSEPKLISLQSNLMDLLCGLDTNNLQKVISMDYEENSIVCVVTPNQSAGELEHSLYLSLNGQDVHELADLRFYEIDPVTIVSMEPTTIFSSILTTLYVKIDSTDMKSLLHLDWYCQINEQIVIGEWWSVNMIQCPVFIDVVGIYSVKLSYNQQTWFGDETIFITSKYVFTSLTPAYLPFELSMPVWIHGYPFDHDIPVILKLTYATNPEIITYVVTTYENETTLSFMLPSIPMSNNTMVKIDTVVNDIETSTKLVIQLHPTWKIMNHTPPYVLPHGNQQMIVCTDEILSTEMTFFLSLRMKSTPTTIILIPTIVDHCFYYETPGLSSFVANNSDSLLANTSYQIIGEISGSNGYDLGSFHYQYLPDIQMIALHPNEISEFGGIIEIITNMNPIIPNALCRFDDMIVSSLKITKSSIFCQAPILSIGITHVWVSLNHGNDWLQVQDNLSVLVVPQTLTLFPTFGPKRGGTNMTIYSIPSLDTKNLFPFCKFGQIEIAAYILPSNHDISCITPTLLDTGMTTITIVLRQYNGRIAQVLPFNMSFEIYADEQIVNMFPKDGPATGGTLITITGKNFIPSDSLIVRFTVNDTYAMDLPTDVSTPDMIQIITPESPSVIGPAIATLSLSNNNFDFIDQSIQYEWTPSVTVSSISPKMIVEYVGGHITIRGNGFYPSYPNLLWCRFGSLEVTIATYIDSTEIRCPVPKRSADTVVVEVTMNGQNFIAVGEIAFIALPVIHFITPLYGFDFGGTMVTVQLTTDTLYSLERSIDCVFGGTTVQADFISPTQLVCQSPPDITTIDNKYVSVYLLIQGEGSFVIATEGITFGYYALPKISSHTLLAGPQTGDTYIRFNGKYASYPEFHFRFGIEKDTIIDANYLSSTEIGCLTPSIALDSPNPMSMSLPIYLSCNGIDFMNTGLEFYYYPSNEIEYISPLVGPVEGNIEIRFFGSYSLLGSASTCIFGETRSIAYYITPNMIGCLLPSREHEGKVPISFTTNGLNIDYTEYMFEYISNIGLIAMTPTFGSYYGGTILIIQLVNANYNISTTANASWYCAFNNIAILATQSTDNPNYLSCITPSMDDISITTINFQVMIIVDSAITSHRVYLDETIRARSIIASGSLLYTYIYPIVLTSISPKVTYNRMIPYNFTVIGYNFQRSNTSRCLWNDGLLYTRAIIMNETLLYCESPIGASNGQWKVSIILNEQIETTNALMVDIQNDPKYLSLEPIRVIQESNSTVSIVSTGLSMYYEDPVCGYYIGKKNIANVTARIYSPILLECMIPKTLPIQREIQRITIQGQTPRYEVQGMDIFSLPERREIQRIATSAYGLVSTQKEIRISASGITTNKAGIYRLQTSLPYVSEIQKVLFKPTAYIQEIQQIHVTGLVTFLEAAYQPYRDTGYFIAHLYNSNLQIPWNASENQLRDQLYTISSLRNITVTKHVSSIDAYQHGLFTSVNITWTISFGIANGDIPTITIPSTHIPRNHSLQYQVTTKQQGIACELQEVTVFGANGGTFALQYQGISSSNIPFNASEIQFRNALLTSFTTLSDIHIERQVLGHTMFQWFIYFNDTPGNVPQITPMISHTFLQPILHTAFVTSSELQSGMALLLTGNVTLSNGGLTSPVSVNVNAGSSVLLHSIPTAATIQVTILNAMEIQWMIHYHASYGNVNLLSANMNSLTSGTLPIMKATELLPGYGPFTQSIKLNCTAGFNNSGSFALVYDDEQTSVILKSTLSVNTIETALQKLPKLTNTTVSLSSTTHLITITIVINDGAIEDFTKFISVVSPPLCLDNHNAGTVYTVITNNTVEPVTGVLTFHYANHSVDIPSDISSTALVTVLEEFGLGLVQVKRTSTVFGTYIWDITFLEMSLPVPLINVTSSLSDTRVNVHWKSLQTPTYTCCLKTTGVYILHNIHTGHSSHNLTLHSTSQEVGIALQQIGIIGNLSQVTINTLSRPSQGKSWLINFLDSTVNDSRLSLHTVSTFSQSSGGLPGSAQLISLQHGVKPQTQRIFILGQYMMEGYFRLSLQGKNSSYLSVNITQQRFRDDLMEQFGLEDLSIIPINLDKTPGIPGEYRCWDISFISNAGSVPLLQCHIEQVNIQSKDKSCTVTVVQQPTSTMISGNFTLSYNGVTSVPISYNANTSVITSIVQQLTSYSVSVSRASVEYDNSYAWLVTFLVDSNIPRNLIADGTNLHGTMSRVRVTTEQLSSQLTGNITIGFGDSSNSITIPHDILPHDFARAIVTLPGIENVSVTMEQFAVGNRYQITFLNPVGDIDNLYIINSHLLGAQAGVKAYEIVKGIGHVHTTFGIQFGNEMTTSMLNTMTNSSMMTTALQSLSGIGEVLVSRNDYYGIAHSLYKMEWLVTFTTMGKPTNIGNNMTIQMVNMLPMNGKYVGYVDIVQHACCDIRLSYNNGYQFSQEYISFIIDKHPVILSIEPITGYTDGGEHLTIIGTNFMISDQPVYCNIGGKRSIAMVSNATIAYCITPPNSEGHYIVTLEFFHMDQLAERLSMTTQEYTYEQPMSILHVTPDIGSIVDNNTIVMEISTIGFNEQAIVCYWTIEVHNPFLPTGLSVFQEMTETLVINQTFLSCPVPSVTTYLRVKSTNYSLETNATAIVTLSKNNQSFSNEMSYYLYAQPNVFSIVPSLGWTKGNTQVIVYGSNFLNSKYTFCKVGLNIVPLQVWSPSTAMCITPPINITSPVHQVSILGPYIRPEIHSFEIWLAQIPHRSSWFIGRMNFYSEGYSYKNYKLTGSLLTSDELQRILESFARLGKVNVTLSTRYANVSNIHYTIHAYEIVYLTRQGDIPLPTVEYANVTEIVSQDSMMFIKVQQGGSDSAHAEIQSWEVIQSRTVPSIQRVVIQVPRVGGEMQIISLTSKSPLSGFFTLTYHGYVTPLLSYDSSADAIAAALNQLNGTGEVHATRKMASNAYGYVWTVTFIDTVGNRPLLTATKSSNLHGKSISLTVSRYINGTFPFTGTFRLSIDGSNYTSPLSLYDNGEYIAHTLSDLSGEIFNVSTIAIDDITQEWLVTFPLVFGHAHNLTI